MKIRNGFVSNSSSSSFLLVGYQAKKRQITPQDYRAAVEKQCRRREIKKFALEYFSEDDDFNVDDFNKFHTEFWKSMWETIRDGSPSLGYDVPEGMRLFANAGYIGTEVASRYDQQTSATAKKVMEAIEKVKKVAPEGAVVEVVAYSQYE